MGVKSQELLETLLKGRDLDETQVEHLIATLSSNASMLQNVCRLILNERRNLRAEAAKARTSLAELSAELEGLREPPLLVAEVLRAFDGRVDVVCGSRRQILTAAPELDLAALQTGDEVLVNAQMTAVLRKSDVRANTGTVAVVRDVASGEGLVVVRTVGDEELVASCAGELEASLEVGDRVLLRRESQCVVKKLGADRAAERFRLERVPEHGFEAIGGLDDVISRIRKVLDLALLHPEVARRFRVDMPSGMTLVGPPGTGKTTMARAIARYLHDSGRETHFLSVNPGDLRASLYGESEARIRQLFQYIRRASGLVVLFFDEVESFGVREHGPGESIDARVLSALLVELDGIASARNLFAIAATNRLDLCDDALVRGGRLGTIIEHVGRPDRSGARQIFAKYLQADVPYGDDREPTTAEQICDAAASYLYSETKGPGVIATAVFANAERRDVFARDVVSGAFIATAVGKAKQAAANRSVDDGTDAGVLIADVLDAVDATLGEEAAKLKSVRSARRILTFEDAEQIARVEVPKRKRTPRHRYLSAA